MQCMMIIFPLDIAPEKSHVIVWVKKSRDASRINSTRLMPSSKRQPPSPGEDMESIFAMSSMDPEWDTSTI